MPPGLLIALALCLSKELQRLPYDVPCGFPGSLAGGSPSLGLTLIMRGSNHLSCIPLKPFIKITLWTVTGE